MYYICTHYLYLYSYVSFLTYVKAISPKHSVTYYQKEAGYKDTDIVTLPNLHVSEGVLQWVHFKQPCGGDKCGM